MRSMRCAALLGLVAIAAASKGSSGSSAAAKRPSGPASKGPSAAAVAAAKRPSHSDYFESASDWIGYADYLFSGGAQGDKVDAGAVTDAVTRAAAARRRETSKKTPETYAGFYSADVTSLSA